MSSRENPKAVWVRSLVPKEKNSATSAISPATRAARGSSIIVPHSTWSSWPASLRIWRATGSSSSRTWDSSSRVAASGIMISTIGLPPSALTLAAASMMARTCMAYRPGLRMPRRTPRSPSIGLASCRSLTLASISVASSRGSASSAPTSTVVWPCWVARATATASSTWSGRNSCSGGSSSRTVTGLPSMAAKMPTKSSRCSGNRVS